MEKFDALIFDCDGVLVNSEELVLIVELELLAEFGLEYNIDEFSKRFLGAADKQFFASLAEDAKAGLGQPLPPTFPEMLKSRARKSFDQHLAVIAGVHELIVPDLATQPVQVIRASHARQGAAGPDNDRPAHFYRECRYCDLR